MKIALFTVSGAIVNIAMAWGCAAWVDIGATEARGGLTDFTGPQWLIVIYERPGATRIMTRPRWFARDYNPRAKLPGRVPYWSQARKQPDPRERDQLYAPPTFLRLEFATGWPLRSMMWYTNTTDAAWNGGPNDKRPRWSIELPRGPARRRVYLERRSLPLLPIWPGFAINTISYALLLWLIWLITLVPSLLRRYFRQRRGHCTKCGYDLRGTEHEKCPECGKELIARMKP